MHVSFWRSLFPRTTCTKRLIIILCCLHNVCLVFLKFKLPPFLFVYFIHASHIPIFYYAAVAVSRTYTTLACSLFWTSTSTLHFSLTLSSLFNICTYNYRTVCCWSSCVPLFFFLLLLSIRFLRVSYVLPPLLYADLQPLCFSTVFCCYHTHAHGNIFWVRRAQSASASTSLKSIRLFFFTLEK